MGGPLCPPVPEVLSPPSPRGCLRTLPRPLLPLPQRPRSSPGELGGGGGADPTDPHACRQPPASESRSQSPCVLRLFSLLHLRGVFNILTRVICGISFWPRVGSPQFFSVKRHFFFFFPLYLCCEGWGNGKWEVGGSDFGRFGCLLFLLSLVTTPPPPPPPPRPHLSSSHTLVQFVMI